MDSQTGEQANFPSYQTDSQTGEQARSGKGCSNDIHVHPQIAASSIIYTIDNNRILIIDKLT